MQYLNYAYFLIFVLFAILGFNKAYFFLHLRKNGQKALLKTTRGEYLIYYLTLTCILAFYSPGALDLAALRLLITQVILLLILACFSRGMRLTWPISFYLTFLIWNLLSSLFCEYSLLFSLRTFSKYLYPFLVFSVSSSVVKNHELPLKISRDLIKVALLSVCILFIPFTNKIFKGLFYYGTAITIFYIVISAILLTTYYLYSRKLKYIILSVSFMLPCLLWGYRTSLLANAVMLSIFAIFIFKTRALLAIGLTFGLGVSIIFFTPSIKEKMFFDSQQVTIKDFKEGRISVEQINSNGRFNTWGKLLNRYYKNHKILGSGTGTTQGSMQINKSFGGLTVPHNDYVTLLCDNGLLGLILYLSSFITIIWQCFRKFNNIQSSTEIRFCAIIAGSTLSAIITAMFTENIINYSIATLTIPFVFYGIMMGLSWGKNHNDDFDNYSSL